MADNDNQLMIEILRKLQADVVKNCTDYFSTPYTELTGHRLLTPAAVRECQASVHSAAACMEQLCLFDGEVPRLHNGTV